MAEPSGAPDRELWRTWRGLINLTPTEIRYFLEEFPDAGLSRSEASEQGVKSGRDSARALLRMIPSGGRSYAQAERNWTRTDWQWARRQVSFIRRMLGNEGPLWSRWGDEPTPKLQSLWIWGHDPEGQLERNAAPIPADRYYHGTSSDEAGRKILARGSLWAASDKELQKRYRGRPEQIPIVGRVYVTRSLSEAFSYSGMSLVGYSSHRWIFEVDAAELPGDVDEDEVLRELGGGSLVGTWFEERVQAIDPNALSALPHFRKRRDMIVAVKQAIVSLSPSDSRELFALVDPVNFAVEEPVPVVRGFRYAQGSRSPNAGESVESWADDVGAEVFEVMRIKRNGGVVDLASRRRGSRQDEVVPGPYGDVSVLHSMTETIEVEGVRIVSTPVVVPEEAPDVSFDEMRYGGWVETGETAGTSRLAANPRFDVELYEGHEAHIGEEETPFGEIEFFKDAYGTYYAAWGGVAFSNDSKAEAREELLDWLERRHEAVSEHEGTDRKSVARAAKTRRMTRAAATRAAVERAVRQRQGSATGERRTSFPARWLTDPSRPGDLHGQVLVCAPVLDYGCGKDPVDAQRFHWAWYDETWSPRLGHMMPTGPFITILGTYTLDVLPPKEQADLIKQNTQLLSKYGRIFYSVRRDIENATRIDGKQTLYRVRLEDTDRPGLRVRSIYRKAVEIYEVTWKSGGAAR